VQELMVPLKARVAELEATIERLSNLVIVGDRSGEASRN